MASLKLLLSLLVVSHSFPSAVSQPQPPPQSIINAADTLASWGYTAMSLTLQLIAPTLPLPSAAITTLTIFSPPNAAFSSSGQPSLSLLLLHFSPLSLPPASLLSLPFSSTIPSLSSSGHLVVTSNRPEKISINDVGVSEIPIFDDGSVVVYAIENFFDPNFTRTNSNSANPRSNFQCLKLESTSKFEEASGVLKSRGYSIIASFIDLQLIGHFGPSLDLMTWTVFAPLDEYLVQFSGEFPRYASLFMRHLAPCRVGYGQLEEMENGTVVSNSASGFGLEITRDENKEMVMVSGAEITSPDLYESEWLVIHGVRGLISLPETADEEMGRTKDLSVERVPDADGEYVRNYYP